MNLCYIPSSTTILLMLVYSDTHILMMFILTQVYFHIDTDIHIEWGIQSLLIAADPRIDTFLIHTFWSYLYTLSKLSCYLVFTHVHTHCFAHNFFICLQFDIALTRTHNQGEA